MRPAPARVAAAPMPTALPALRGVTCSTALAAVAGLTVLVGLSLVTTHAVGASAAPSAQGEYDAALKVAAQQKGVHFDSALSQGGVSITVSGDSGTTSGTQTITVKRGNLTEHVRAMVVGKSGYVNANATALHYVVGLTNAQATKYAGKWLYFPTSNAGLAELVAGLQNSQVASELQMTGPFSYGPMTTVQGQRARAIRGYVTSESGSKVRVVLYVPAAGTPNPIEEVTNPGAAKDSPTIHGSVSLSRWGQQVTQTAPAHSVPLLKLGPPATSGATSTTAG